MFIYFTVLYIHSLKTHSLKIARNNFANGCGLTEDMLEKMKSAGLTGLSFNINSSQERPEFNDKYTVNQSKLNEVRLKYAKMVSKVGGLAAAFKITVSNDNFNEIPGFVQWSINNSKLIHSITLVAHRGLPVGEGIEYYADREKIDLKPGSLGYTISAEEKDKITITSKDIYSKIKEHYP